jgi:predicted DNA-binding transcriptional regulator AlpA
MRNAATTTRIQSSHVPTIRASDRDGYLTAGQVVERYSTSMSWILRRQADSGFPPAIKLGGRLRFWRVADIEAWERKQVRQ